jgi:predicted amidophosphoribosyltransferase
MILPETPKTAAVVMKVPDTLLSHGHILWMVNFYNSPELARQLKIENCAACVGTLKLNRKNVPKEVNEKNEERRNHSEIFGSSHGTKMV